MVPLLVEKSNLPGTCPPAGVPVTTALIPAAARLAVASRPQNNISTISSPDWTVVGVCPVPRDLKKLKLTASAVA